MLLLSWISKYHATLKLHELYLKCDCFCVGFIDQHSLLKPPMDSAFYTYLIKVIRIDHQQQDIMMKVIIDFDHQQAWYQFDNDQSSALNKYVLPTHEIQHQTITRDDYVGCLCLDHRKA